MYELINRLRAQAVYLPEKFSKNAELLDVLMKAADAIEELMEFARFVAEEVVVDDDEWGNNQNAFPEIACRKLFKLGILSRDGEMWHYEPQKEE